MSVSWWRHDADFDPSAFDVLGFDAGQAPGPASRRLLAVMDGRFSEAYLGTVMIQGFTEPMREWLAGDRGTLPHVDALLGSPQLTAVLPDPFSEGGVRLGMFSRLHPLQLAGSIARHVFEGGAYSASAVSAVDPARLGEEVVAELIGDRYEQCHVAWCEQAWTEWFSETPWTGTWVVSDLLTGHTTVFGYADFD